MLRIAKKISPALTVFLAACAGGCDPPDDFALNVPLNGQEETLWCWAASGQMTMNFIHPASNVQQCDQANKSLKKKSCCKSARPNKCNQGGYPQYGEYDFDAEVTSNALSWDDIKNEIYCRGKPFTFAYRNIGGTSHMKVVKGYKTDIIGVKMLVMNDPWPSPTGTAGQWIAYDTYTGYTDNGSRTEYYNIRYTGE